MLRVFRAVTEWANPDAPAFLRTLGPVERTLLQYHDKLLGSGNTARVVTFDGPLTADLLRESLAVLQCRHPFLRVGIARTPAPVFVDRPHAVVPITTRARTAAGDWIGVVEDALAQRFDVASGPLLRVIWLEGSVRQLPDVLVFITCHVITDGFSSSKMVAEFFEILAKIDVGDVPSRASRSLPPAMAGLFPEHFSGLAVAWRFIEFVVRQVANGAMWPAPLPSEVLDPEERKTRLLPYALPLSTIERLTAQAKKNGATLHSAFLAAKLIAAATLIEERHDAPTPMTLTAVTTTNLRARLRGAGLETELAARVGGLRGASKVHSGSDFWPLARQVMDDMQRGIAGNDDILGTLLAPLFACLQVNMPSLPMASVQIANLGKSPVRERYGRFTVASVQAALNVCGFGPSLLSHITTTGTGTYWNFLYCEPLFRRDDAVAYATTTMRLVRRMATSD